MGQKQKTIDKWVSAILSIILPGVGHVYLGYAGRGLIIIGAFILDIALIVFSSFLILVVLPAAVALITIFALALPVIYFFSIFDALQMAERKFTHHRDFSVTERQTTDGNDPSGREVEKSEDIWRYQPASHTKEFRVAPRALGIVLIITGIGLTLIVLLPDAFFRWLFDHVQALFAVLLLAGGIWLVWKQWDQMKGGKQ